jgi:nitrite reductase/ring-hydroxylating ferredoxin subunit
VSGWTEVCLDEELVPGRAQIIDLERPGGRGPRRQAMVVRLPNGEIRAYHNLCKHLPVPLDSFRDRVLADDKSHFLCRTHGACFQLSDGMCFEGPCQGASLDAIAVRLHNGKIEIQDAP